MSMKDVARRCAVELLNAGASKKKGWTPAENRDWTLAFNALQRLAGKKIMRRRGRFVTVSKEAA